MIDNKKIVVTKRKKKSAERLENRRRAYEMAIRYKKAMCYRLLVASATFSEMAHEQMNVTRSFRSDAQCDDR